MFISPKRSPGTNALGISLCAVLAAGMLSGCTIEKPGADAPDPTTGAAAAPASIVHTAQTQLAGPAEGTTDLDEVAREVSQEVDQPVGVALSRQGEVRSGGEVSGGAAWSTIKVPLSVAALRAAAAGTAEQSEVTPLVERAITVSDNAAAEGLWAKLGGAPAAGQAAETVLADAGDSQTKVQTQKVRPEFSPWGQTQWSLADQARFAEVLPALEGAAGVVEAMGRIDASQSWGLGSLERVRFKGGWGPDASGSYDVRQLGFLETECGVFGVAIATTGGTFETGQRALSALAAKLAPSLSCGAGGQQTPRSGEGAGSAVRETSQVPAPAPSQGSGAEGGWTQRSGAGAPAGTAGDGPRPTL